MGKTFKLKNDIHIANDLYSTSERVIGTWVDGKTLYRKCVAITLPDNGEASFSTGLSNVNVISLTGTVKSGTTSIPIIYNNVVYAGTSIHCFYSNGTLFVGCSFSGTNYTGYVILEYTKNL